jgi:hypothetical protein
MKPMKKKKAQQNLLFTAMKKKMKQRLLFESMGLTPSKMPKILLMPTIWTRTSKLNSALSRQHKKIKVNSVLSTT